MNTEQFRYPTPAVQKLNATVLQKIPDDHACTVIFRRLAQTRFYEARYTFTLDNRVLSDRGGSRVESFKYYDDLWRYFYFGWPTPKLGPIWTGFFGQKDIEVYGDNLYLCPRCGHFDQSKCLEENLENNFVNEFVKLGKTSREEICNFTLSRLMAPEFLIEPCVNARECEKRRLLGIREYKSRHGTDARQSSPEIKMEIAKRKVEKAQVKTSTSIYLMKGGNFYKIGIAANAKKRLSGIRVSCPFPVEIVKVWQSRDAASVEEIMHSRFVEHHANGEWFQLPAEAINFLLRIENIDSVFLQAEASE